MQKSVLQYQVIQGIVSRLQKQHTHVHYLENVKQEQRLAGTVAVIQAATGQAGAVLSAQAATDEGDPVEGFAMEVAGHPVHGSFWKTTFQDGDNVQVVGNFQNGVFHAIAVTKPEERMIWMQPHAERGTKASARNIMNKASISSLLLFVIAPVLAWLMNESIGLMLMMAIIGCSLIWVVMVLWSWGDFMCFAHQMNNVGAALGMPEPENIDLFKSTKQAKANGKPDLPMGVYYY